MDSLTISLPDAERAFVEGQVAEGRYNSASDYVRALIRADEERKAHDRLDALLLEGLNSPATKWTVGDVAALRTLAATGR